MKNTTHLISSIKNLNEEDFINEILYLIYKFNDNPKYSGISELIYVLGKDDLLKLCSVFGGCDLRIPTLLELKLFIGGFYVYYAMHTTNCDFESAFKELNLDNSLKKQIYSVYMAIEEQNEQG